MSRDSAIWSEITLLILILQHLLGLERPRWLLHSHVWCFKQEDWNKWWLAGYLIHHVASPVANLGFLKA